MIVIDASVAVEALLGNGACRQVVTGTDELLVAPQLIDSEVVSVLRRLVLNAERDRADAERCLVAWSGGGIVRYPVHPLLTRVFELHQMLTADDATYVALAEALDASVTTTDARLARASGPTCEVRLIGE